MAGADLRTLRSLASKSLITLAKAGEQKGQQTQPSLRKGSGERYGVHELLRQYGEGKLDERPQAREEALDRHCAYYCRYVQHREQDISWRVDLREALPEMDNIRAAWRRAASRCRLAEIRSLMAGLHDLCYLQGLYAEGESGF